MPTYTFRCRKCGQATVVEHGFGGEHPSVCAKMVNRSIEIVNQAERRLINLGSVVCGGELERVFDVPNITYHGSGFYHTDKVLYDPDPDAEG